MFDKHFNTTGRSHVSVQVNEKRAPTDESIRLLREMEEKLEKRLLGAFRIGDNSFYGSIHVLEEWDTCMIKAKIRFTLNGVECRCEAEEDRAAFKPQEFAMKCLKVVQEEVSRRITANIFKDNMDQFTGLRLR